jgi:hypothetical protein
MPIDTDAIRLGHCYATAAGDVRKIIDVTAGIITYVNRGKLAFPTWDAKKWHAINRAVFAREVLREVSCDWQAD